MDLKKMFNEEIKKRQREVEEDRYRLSYHLMPPVGWMNDPNGLCEYQGTHHIFYQYTPFNADGTSKKGWGHYTTKDFISYDQEPVKIVPENYFDACGVYSGSAYITEDQIRFFYTGNFHEKEGDYDYINKYRGHYVCGFESKDGKEFTKAQVILKNSDYPEDMSCHVRDPKIYKQGDSYYMVLGARTKTSKGCILIYQSEDLDQWRYYDRVEAAEEFGYMWECPDLFELGGDLFLICCPQGLERKGSRFENVYANGYFKLNPNLKNNHQLKEEDFIELDKGFDFYAPQSYEDDKGRRILIGWMGIGDLPYHNPTVAKGWQHTLTLPRELTNQEGKLYQYPIKEINKLKKDHQELIGKSLHTNHVNYHLHLSELDKEFKINMRDDMIISYKDGLFTLSLGKSGAGRDKRNGKIDKIKEIDIYSDTSAIEIYLNKGEEVYSSRIYDSQKDISLEADQNCKIVYSEMAGFVIKK